MNNNRFRHINNNYNAGDNDYRYNLKKKVME